MAIHRFEISCKQQFRSRTMQGGICLIQTAEPFVIQIKCQYWLVNLHPFHTKGCEPCQDIAVNRQQVWQQVQSIEAWFGLLAKI